MGLTPVFCHGSGHFTSGKQKEWVTGKGILLRKFNFQNFK